MLRVPPKLMAHTRDGPWTFGKSDPIDALEREIASLVRELAQSLLAVQSCGPLSVAKLLGETAGVSRILIPNAFARHHGTAPLPVGSSN